VVNNFPQFLALNPLAMSGFGRWWFSGDWILAILDYLEARYPELSLLPSDAKALARVRMVQLVTLNELLPRCSNCSFMTRTQARSAELEYAQLRAINTLSFLENLLGDSYFASEQLTLAEIVAGTLVYRMPDLGIARLSKIECLVCWHVLDPLGSKSS